MTLRPDLDVSRQGSCVSFRIPEKLSAQDEARVVDAQVGVGELLNRVMLRWSRVERLEIPAFEMRLICPVSPAPGCLGDLLGMVNLSSYVRLFHKQ